MGSNGKASPNMNMKRRHLPAVLFIPPLLISGSHAFLLRPELTPPPCRIQSLTSTASSSTTTFTSTTTSLSSFMADGSDYKADKSDYGEPSEDPALSGVYSPLRNEDDMANVPVVEEIPVPMSRNNVGNRFVALAFDRLLSRRYKEEFANSRENGEDGESGGDEMVCWKMHEERVALSEEHVMWARKQNLYNETFNTESMADVLWSHQLLSSDLQRAIGHAMCIDSPTLDHAREALSRDPILCSLLGTNGDTNGDNDSTSQRCDVSSLPLYRWRHIRDHTLRRDDGRNGYPTLLLAFDRPEAISDGIREEFYHPHLEYLIKSERIIAAGPLHVATQDKTDENSMAVGTLMLFNAKNREDAIEFVEKDPLALAGLYETMTVHRYNSLDVTGKFVSENLWYPRQNTYQMKEAMGYWGYPVDDDQTKWLNW